MALGSFWYHKAAFRVGDGTINLNTSTFDVMLTNSTHVADKSDEFIDDAGADDAIDGEIGTVTNYVRKNFNPSWTDDAANDRATLDNANIVWTALGGAANDTIEQAEVVGDTGADTARRMIIHLGVAATSTNGNDLTLNFDATGIGYMQA